MSFVVVRIQESTIPFHTPHHLPWGQDRNSNPKYASESS